MRIVIDLQGVQTASRFRGIGRYSLSFAQAIVRNCGEHEVFLALNGLFPETIESIRTAFDGLLPQENIRVWYAPGPVAEGDSANAWRRKVAELIREAFLASLHPDVIHLSSLFEGYVDDAVTSIGRLDQTTPVSVSLYDLIPLLNPDHYLKPNASHHVHYSQKVAQLSRASLMLAISESTRREALTNFDAVPEQVVNVSTAIEDRFCPLALSETVASAIKIKLGITSPFILYTGAADERKNLARLIEAFSRLTPSLRQSHQLVLAGNMDRLGVDRLKSIAINTGFSEGKIVFTGYVSDDELISLYNLCAIFVFPSWHEGFGLPILEAMCCGAVVIASNASSLPEVIDYEDALFDPLDVNDIAAKMELALTDERFRSELRGHGFIQAKKFSWDKTAQRSISAFENIPSSHQEHCDNEESVFARLIQEIVELTQSDVKEPEIMEIAYAIDRSFQENVSKQLLVDISELVQRDARTGVQRVTRSILHQLLTMPLVGYIVEPVYATIGKPGYRYARNFVRQFGDEISSSNDEPISIRSGDVFLGLDLQHSTTIEQANFLSQARRDGVNVYFVIYDLLPIQFPGYWPKEHLVDLVHRDWLYTICSYDGVVCISRTVADELKVWLKDNSPPRLRPLAIKWFHLGADVKTSVPTTGLPDDVDKILIALASRSTFLSVGTIEPRKGQAQTLAAFELLWEIGEDINLVFVGKEGWMVEALVKKIRHHEEFGKRLFWLEGISDEYLEKVYPTCTCLIAASEGEGFGLPLIEAAQHNLPIIARDIPVFREVAGDYAFYFNGLAPGDMEAAIKVWLDLKLSGNHPKSQSMPYLSWQESARQLRKQLNLSEKFYE